MAAKRYQQNITDQDRVLLFVTRRIYVQNITVSFAMFDANLEVLFFGDRPHTLVNFHVNTVTRYCTSSVSQH